MRLPSASVTYAFFQSGRLPMCRPTRRILPELAERADLRHLHLEQRLDRLADLDLVGARVHAEHDLVAQLVHQRALLGDHRAQDDVGRVHASTFDSGSAAL